MSVYRPIPTRDAAPPAPTDQRPSFGQRVLCAIGRHKRVLDFVNQLAFCTACNRVISMASREIGEACDGRIRFEIEYMFIQARRRGKMTGNGLLRWHGHGVPASKEVAARWAEEAQAEFLRADLSAVERGDVTR